MGRAKSTTKARDQMTVGRAGGIAKRFGVNLRKRDFDRLQDISERFDVTATEVIRHAIAVEHKLVDVLDKGGHVYIERSNGKRYELEFDLGY